MGYLNKLKILTNCLHNYSLCFYIIYIYHNEITHPKDRWVKRESKTPYLPSCYDKISSHDVAISSLQLWLGEVIVFISSKCAYACIS